jgi:hypothetical protein
VYSAGGGAGRSRRKLTWHDICDMHSERKSLSPRRFT